MTPFETLKTRDLWIRARRPTRPHRVRPCRWLVSTIIIVAVSCGGGDDDQVATNDEETRTSVDEPASEPEIETTPSPSAESSDETADDGDELDGDETPGPSPTPRPTPTPTRTPQSATPTPTPTITPTPTPSEPDDASLLTLGSRGLLRAPDATSSRCEMSSSGGRSAGSSWGAYVDATNGGDLYVLCAAVDPSTDITAASLTGPGGAPSVRLGLTVLDVEIARLSDLDSNAVAGAGPNGFFEQVGLREPFTWTSDLDVLQLHIWLPHGRTPGDWRFSLTTSAGDISGQLTVDAPCVGSGSVSNPFDIPANFTNAGYLFSVSDELTRADNCRLMPDLTARPVSNAVDALDDMSAQLDVSFDIVQEAGPCGAEGVGGHVTMQSPTRGFVVLESRTITLERSIDCPPTPDGLIGRSWSDVRTELEALAANYDEWSFTTIIPNVALSSCVFELSRTVTRIEGEPGDYDDLLFVYCGAYGVTGRVFDDANQNGVLDSGEGTPERAHWLDIVLRDAAGNELDTDFPSSSTGVFHLITQTPGPYRITIEPALSGFEYMPTTPTTVDAVATIEEWTQNLNFGYMRN